MDDLPFWEQYLQGFEPTAFPDLTGLSPEARKQLDGWSMTEAAIDIPIPVLEETCEEWSVDLASILQAAWLKVLAAYTGELDLCLGYLQASVSRDSNAGPGASSETRPLRTTFDTTTTHADLVRRLKDRHHAIRDRAPPPYPQVHTLLGPDVNTLYDTVLHYDSQDTPVHPLDNSTHVVHLQVLPRPSDDSFLARLHCKRSVISPEDIHHVLNTFQQALSAVLCYPRDHVTSWPRDVPSPSISAFNWDYQQAESPFGDLVHNAVERHAQSTPNQIALDFEESDGRRTVWTYAILNSIGDRIAELLIDTHNLQVEDSVPLCVSKSPAFYACVLGVLKAGACFTPFSDSPPERKIFMLDELCSKMVLTVDGEDMSWCTNTSIVNISAFLDPNFEASAPSHRSFGKPTLNGSNLAYQMYTSGSTGRPKAVSVEHRNAVQATAASKNLVPWTSNSRMLQYAAPSFDMCYYDTFLAWSLGICLCSAPSSSVFDDLTGVINRLDVHLLGLTPSVALTLDPMQVSTIKWMYCIGEQMPQSLVQAWEGRLVNSYGPTEAAQMVTIFPVSSRVKSAVIGKAFRNTSFMVVQKGSESVAPLFGLGELCIGGSQVARGYYNNEKRTNESFVIKHGARVYKTGDNVRMLSSGNFEFVGRTDDQVKIRGQRVELGEINNVLKQAHQHITNVSTLILKIHEQSRDQLVAFLAVSMGSEAPDRDELRMAAASHAQAHLPSFMVPRLFILVDAIPLSAAGKVDKRALIRILHEDSEQPGAAARDVADKPTQIEQLLLQIFSQTSGVPQAQIKATSSIFELGLDSISAIRVASQLKSKGYAITATDVLTNPTADKLAVLLDQRGGVFDRPLEDATPDFDFGAFDDSHRNSVAKAYKIQQTSIATIRPCSPLQAGMVAQSIHFSGAMYFNHLTYDTPSDIDQQSFLAAWDALLERHEILRSGFVHLSDPKYPVAMVTYRSRATELPVELSHRPRSDLESWRRHFAESALSQLHRPPWQVLLVPGKMYFSAHHALYDAQVLELLIRDLDIAYSGARLPPAISLEPYLARVLYQSGEQAPAAAFWKSFGERSAISKFPVMTPLEIHDRTLIVSSKLCSTSLGALEAGCRSTGVTMQAAGQAAWGLLLAAYLGEDVVTFGTVLGGRSAEGSNEVAFPCITTVPTSVKQNQSRRLLLESLMKFNAEVQLHQFTSLKQIQRTRGRGEEPLFDTLFTYQKHDVAGSSDNVFKYVDNELIIDYPISVELEPTATDGLEIRLYHRADRVPREQGQLMVHQLEMLLDRLLTSEVADSDGIIIGNADTHLYSIDAPAVPAFDSPCKLLHQLVEDGARKNPEKTALEYVRAIHDTGIDRRRWTYKALNEEGNRVANFIVERKIPQGSLVAVCFDKCPEASFAMLGILKAGCGFLALDPGAPIERKRFILEDSEAPMLITKGLDHPEAYNGVAAPIVDLDAEDLSHFSCSTPILGRSVNDQEVSYCLYTSGTTGTPKGCVITHENVVQAMLTFQRLYKHTETSRWLAFASYHFDVSVMEQYWSWSVGMCCVVASRDLVFEDIAGTIRALDITHIDLTPSLARVLHPDDVPSLANGVFVTGGEMLKKEIIEAWGDTGAIHNAYGPTEATIGCTMFRGVPKNGRPSNIGPAWPIAGTMVVDPTDPQKPVLRGAIGELCVTGKLVAKGYVKRPELTTERFITLGGQRAYRTGDLVRVLHDGCFDFLGRADDQVKLRGQRLEIGEINTVIQERDAAVLDVSTLVVRHPQQQKEQLVAFVVAEEFHDRHNKPAVASNTPNELLPDLKAACEEKLPGYMVPTHIVPLTSLPLSANNKVDAKQLKALYNDTSIDVIQHLSADHIINADDGGGTPETEQTIHEALAKILGLNVQDIPKASSFFELGLDSISVIGFSRSLKDHGFQAASTSVIMRNASVTKLVRALAKIGEEGGVTEAGSIQAAKQKISACQHAYKSHVASALAVNQDEIEAVAPCTPLQLGIITRSLESSRGLYFARFEFDLDEGVDIGRLRQACNDALAHTQILRTRFLTTDDGYIQAVLKGSELPWIDHAAEAGEVEAYLNEQHSQWWRSNQNEILQPFRILLVKTAQKAVLALHIFHALYDGNSLPMLLQQLLSSYYGQQDHYDGPAYHDALPYGPLRELSESQTFWTSHLQPLGQIPSEALQPFSNSPQQHDFVVTSRIEPIEGFEQRRRELNVTHHALVQAAWSVVIQSAMARPLVLGMIVSGRSIDFDGAEKIIGPLFNTIPFLALIQKGDTWMDVIQRSHEFNNAGLPYQHTSLRDIQKWCRKLRPSDSPLFQTLFVFQKDMSEQDKYEPIWTPREEIYVADYPLSLEVVQTLDGGFDVTLGAQGHMSDEDTSRRLLETFEGTLRRIVQSTKENVSASVDIETFAASTANAVSGDAVVANGSGKGNIEANGHINGHTTKDHAVELTPEGIKVRDAVATLADVKPHKILGSTSILELGLDSIDAVKLASRLKRSASLRISVSAIMRSLTIVRIAAVAEPSKTQQKAMDGAAATTETYRALQKEIDDGAHDLADVESVHPCTPLQEGMISEMVNSGFQRYFNHDVLRLQSNVDTGRLQDAWQTVIDHTPILRSRFIEVTDPDLPCTLAQLVLKPSQIIWQDFTVHNEAEFSPALDRIKLGAENAYNSRPPLYLSLVRPSANEAPTHMILSLSHAMYDGWSLGLLHEDVNRAYHNCFQSRPSYEPALHRILDASSPASATFWRDTLNDTGPTIIPSQCDESAFGSEEVHRRELIASVSIDDVQVFCKASNVTISALTQTAWACVLASYTRRLDVSFGQVLSGRDDEDANNIAFPTMNTVISRAVLYGSRLEMVKYMQDNTGAMSEHQHFPLRKALALADAAGKGDLFNSLFIYQKRPIDQDRDNVDEGLYESVGGSSNVEYPVCVEAEVLGPDLIWRTACKGTHFDSEQTRQLLDRLDAVLQAFIRAPREATVSFDKGKARISGLDAFDLVEHSDRTVSRTVSNGEAEDTNAWLPVEQTLRQVIARVAKVKGAEIKKSSNLLSLGLDSISAIKVSSLLRKQGVSLQVNALLKSKTIKAMAKAADASGVQDQFNTGDTSSNHRDALISILRPFDLKGLLETNSIASDSVSQILPATAGQVLLLSRWQNHAVFYPKLFFDITGCDDLQRLGDVWTKVVAETPILRTVFLSTGNTRVPILQAELKQARSDVIEVPSNHSLSEAVDQHAAQTPAFPVRPPIQLFAQVKSNDAISIAIHLSHALYDGFVLPGLVKRLQDLLSNPSANLPAETLTFPSYLAQTVPSTSDHRSFWTSYLTNLQNATIPVQSRPQDTTVRRNNHVVRPHIIDNKTMTALNRLTRANNLTLQSLFLATYATVHAHLTQIKNPSDILIGIYTASRTLPGSDMLMAPTINFVPVRVRKPLARDVVDIAKQIQEDMTEIGEDGRGSRGLWEVDGWVKEQAEGEGGESVRVDVWVNLLRSWEEDGEEEDDDGEEVEKEGNETDTNANAATKGEKKPNKIRITGSEFGAREEKRDDILDMPLRNEDRSHGLCIGGNPVRVVYGAAMDVEVTVHRESMSLGVMAPEEMFDLRGAQGVVGMVVEAVRRVGDKG